MTITNFTARLLIAALGLVQASVHAQGSTFNQAQLDALLAPVALYPDPLLSNILLASTHPEDLRDAAAWSRANPQASGDEAVRAIEAMPWDPSVAALVALPDLLARMDETPQWTADLAAAYTGMEPSVMDTVQGLRQRAQATGYLRSNDQYSVQQQGAALAVYPLQPQVVYAPYYDPFVVYGRWWRPAYRPGYWRPWSAPPVFVSTSFFVSRVDWQRRHIVPGVPHRVFIQNRVVPPHAHLQNPAVTVHDYIHQAQGARPIVQPLPPLLGPRR